MLFILLWMHVRYCCVCFIFSVLSQEIGWEESTSTKWPVFVSGGTILAQSIIWFLYTLVLMHGKAGDCGCYRFVCMRDWNEATVWPIIVALWYSSIQHTCLSCGCNKWLMVWSRTWPSRRQVRKAITRGLTRTRSRSLAGSSTTKTLVLTN